MEIVEQDLATVEEADAYQSGDLLIVRLSGTRPTACHIVSIDRALPDVEPPACAARMRIDPRMRCMQQVAPFEVVQAFRIGGERDEVIVHDSGGERSVQVQQLRAEGDSAERGTPTFPPDPFGEPGEADGYSRGYDLAEAIHDAIGKLPDRGSVIPDSLNSYTIVSMGVEIGGIGGFNHLKVTIRG